MSKVKQGQSFIDKVTELTGNYENALAMALLNGTSITDDAEPKKEYKVSQVSNRNIVRFFDARDKPASDINRLTKQQITDVGIGSMQVESTFVVR